MAERLRVALVGAGRRGQAHLATLRCLPDLFDLVAVCDANEHVAQAAAARAECAPFVDLRACIEKTAPHAVVIVTPAEMHHVSATISAQRGVHMLIETPLATTRALMDAIIDATTKAGVRVEVAENYSRRPMEQLNQAAIRAGLIGDLLHLSVFNAPANEQCVYHTMSLLRAYAGADVAEIHATGRTFAGDRAPRDARGDETWVDASLLFENGVAASVSYTTVWTTPMRWGRPRIHTMEGTNGYIVTSDGTPDRLHRGEDGGPRDYVMQVDTQPVGDGDVPTRYTYAAAPGVEFRNPFADRVLADGGPAGVADGIARAIELRALHAAITEGTPPGYSLAEARRSQELAIAIAESARLGHPMPARLEAETGWEREFHAELAHRWGIDPLDDVDRVLAHALRPGG